MNDEEVKVEIIDDAELFVVAEDKVEKRRNRRKQSTPQRWNQMDETDTDQDHYEDEEDDFYVGEFPPPKMSRIRPEVTSVESLCPKLIRPRQIQPRLNLAAREKEARLDSANGNNIRFSKSCITILTPTSLPNGTTVYNVAQTGLQSAIMSSKLVKCSECIYVFNTTADCEAHMKKAHPPKKKLMPKPGLNFKCAECLDVFANAADAEIHAKEAHPKRKNKHPTAWSCPKCKLSIAGPKSRCELGSRRPRTGTGDTIFTYIQRHLENHKIMGRTRAPLFCCAVCHKSFVKKKTLDMHMIDVHNS